MAVTVNSIKESIDALSANLNENVFVVSAREAFKDGINEYEISDEERAKLIAQYEAQVSIGIMGHVINLAKEIPQVDAQVNLLKQQIDIEKINKAKALVDSFNYGIAEKKTWLVEEGVTDE